jgi:hypothetical protein
VAKLFPRWDNARMRRATIILVLGLLACDETDSSPASDLGPHDGPPLTDGPLTDGPSTDTPLPTDGPPLADGPPAVHDAGVPDAPVKTEAGCTPVVVAPSPDPWSVRAPGIGFGGIVTQKTGAYTDVVLKSPTDYTRIGARVDWGGTVVFFGLSANPGSNVIDANDTGRELQLALYDPTRAMQGCAYNASCQSGGTACPTSITYLGWNPVQGGDECGHGGKVLSWGQKGDALQLVVQPVQWNPDWDEPTCVKNPCPASGVPVAVTYTFELRFLTVHVVEVMSQVTSQESFSHPPTGQEFPTLYVSHGQGGPDLPLLLDAAGNTVALNQPGNDGFYYGNFTSQAPWVSWQNSLKDYGVGLGMDQGIKAFQGWRGDGTTAPYFHNVRAQIAFGLDAGKTVRGLSYLALGGFSTVKAELTAALAKRPPFGVLDLPAGTDVSYTPGQALTVAGWVLDSTSIASVTVTIDGATAATLTVDKQRADVCAVYPGYAGCPNVGFSGSVPTQGLGPCPHLLRVTAKDADGNSTVLGERRLVVKP